MTFDDKQDKYIKLHANCISTKGYSRSLICDLQFASYQFIDNAICDILVKASEERLSLKDFFSHFDSEEKDIVSEYIGYLYENDYIFFTDEPELFPTIKMDWEPPSLITNAIIDFDLSFDQEYLNKVAAVINNSDCEAIQIRCIEPLNSNRISNILDEFDDSPVFSIELFALHHSTITLPFIETIIQRCRRISKVGIFNSDYEKYFHHSLVPISYTKKSIMSECGVINQKYLCFNIDNIIEAHCCNSCLSGKMHIGSKGEIKNCIDSTDIYGNIKTDNFETIVNSSSFQQLWAITKDQIEVCRDCEFRYVCNDCRIHIKYPTDIYSHPSKCTYNPYIAKWDNEEGYETVENYGHHVAGGGFILNKEKITATNQLLWKD